jgi:ABC-type glycerol-3-phosphate transport system substrate-binding protein
MINFKFVLTGIFAVCIVAGIALFALSKGKSATALSANLVVWGTISENTFNRAFQASTLSNSQDLHIVYVKKDSSSFDADFIEALADGVGPDIVILREDSMYKERNKIFTIPYKSLTERSFKDKFIEEGELFLTPDGVLALPFIVDPMVMYWNRDLFSNNVISQPPKYWDEVYDIINKITKKDSNANILQSALALGEWRNITNAKEILLTLLFQSGTPVTQRKGVNVESVLNNQLAEPVIPSNSAVNFYTQFSNPTASSYTWNRSLPNSQNLFLAGNLAMYMGFASELFSIQQKNSNLNFDVTYVPQIRNSPKKTIFGHMYGLAIVKQSKQIGPAFIAINTLTEAAPLKAMELENSLPPVRRDLLADKPTDAYRSVFYNSALYSHSWIDPDPNGTQVTFRDMIESITSGRSKISEALSRADQELSAELK